MGLFGIVYALSSSLELAIIVVTITGFLNAWYYVARRTLIQRNTEREMRGRIFGAMMTIGHVVLLIPKRGLLKLMPGVKTSRQGMLWKSFLMRYWVIRP